MASKDREILHNVYNYLKTLHSAHTDVVKTWDAEEFEKAKQWGTYCEAVSIL